MIVFCFRTEFIVGECLKDRLFSWFVGVIESFLEIRGCNGFFSGLFVSCMFRDVWDWRYCFVLFGFGFVGYCYRGLLSFWFEYSLYFFYFMVFRKDIKD